MSDIRQVKRGSECKSCKRGIKYLDNFYCLEHMRWTAADDFCSFGVADAHECWRKCSGKRCPMQGPFNTESCKITNECPYYTAED